MLFDTRLYGCVRLRLHVNIRLCLDQVLERYQLQVMLGQCYELVVSVAQSLELGRQQIRQIVHGSVAALYFKWHS